MSPHPEIDEKRMFAIDQQVVGVEDTFQDEDLIIDLGGGGEGVIGQLRGRQVVAVDLRRGELEECASGPIKVVADATDLPFLDASFDAATAFFFLMYVPNEQLTAVLREAHRVLRPGGTFHVWDVTIPPRGDREQSVFVVPIKAVLPDRTIETGYGTRWEGREMSCDAIAQMARDAGFAVDAMAQEGETFRLTLTRPAE